MSFSKLPKSTIISMNEIEDVSIPSYQVKNYKFYKYTRNPEISPEQYDYERGLEPDYKWKKVKNGKIALSLQLKMQTR